MMRGEESQRTIEIIRKGNRAGFNLNGKSIGYAALITGGPSKGTWTAFADLYDGAGNFLQPYTRSRCASPEQAAAHLAEVHAAARRINA